MRRRGYLTKDEHEPEEVVFKGAVKVNDRAIELWHTQLNRYGWRDATSGGAAGVANYARRDIREQLHIPEGLVIRRIVHQKRLVRSTGKVWYFEVIATPRRK